MAKKREKIVTVGFIALGCPKNIVDSEKMLAEIAQSGLVITAEPENADVVVINTCGFIEPAKAEALQSIYHAVDCKARGTVKKVIVAGCLPQRLGRQLLDEVPGIDAVMGLGQRDNIPRIIKKTLSCKERLAYLEHWPQNCSNDAGRLLITGRHWAYLRISEGCNHRCSFCTIPAIRGRFRSKPRHRILAEAAELARAGVAELNIIAQDTTYYGRDLRMKNGLAKLITELEKISGIIWIRLMYVSSTGIDDRLIDTIASSEKVVHYLDIPIQHVNNKILKAMRRPDTKAGLRRLIERLRCAVPDIVLRTTLMIGFPGETDRQFDELLDFVKWAEFDALGCFQFYPESGTAAAEMPGQVPESVKQQRLEELMLTQQKIAFAKNKNRIRRKLACLVDSVDDKGTGRGRFYGQAPKVDSICIIENCSAAPGEFINAEVIDTKDYDLVVRPVRAGPPCDPTHSPIGVSNGVRQI
jgi:ribosomal protein S12 methylthiotransferase